ncbi:J domain-containing protein [Halorubrum sp. ASP1]|uniref:J domain-containing protein n=1 Tax=Halorubrum sp. ASP1 TaxID=2518114 RepID=UPI0010F7E8A9|nr:J domain-containing protein [Halorubrum sp. ASP1]TKX57582.1 J domain-containing protein [Halorubrum sp. ASP1]
MSLDWPAGWERTPESERERNRSFEATLGSTTQDIATEMDRMDVDHWRASIANNHTKSSGLPLHNANPDDPGFVLRWSDDGEEFAVASDAYSRLRDNIRTVYLWVHETRMRGNRPVRTGDSEFAAARLPPGDGDEDVIVAGSASKQPPHEVLRIQEGAPDDVVTAAARARKAETHPDQGGSREEFQRVKDAESAMLGGDGS